MATININTLNPAGSDLFADTESYLKELSESELNVQGGLYISPIYSICTLTRELVTQL